MPVFTYTALQKDGTKIADTISAKDRAEALRQLALHKLQLLSLQSSDGSSTLKKAESHSDQATQKLSRTQIVFFTDELADFLEAGLQLEPALKVMENREELSAIKKITASIRQHVREGKSFSGALRLSSPSFDELYCSLAAAGEISGALPQILRRHAQYLTTMQELRSKTLVGLLYPGVLITAGLGVTIIFANILLPELVKMIQDSGKALPLFLQWGLNGVEFLKSYWWALFAFGAVIFLSIKALLRIETYQMRWDRWKLRLPLFGKMIAHRFYVQFLEMLANLLGNGVTLLKALELTRSTTTNRYLRQSLQKVVDMVAEGSSLSKALKRTGEFPLLLIDMVGIGEQTGELAEAAKKAAGRFDKELAKSLQKMSTLLPLVVIILMTCLVGTMAYVMLSLVFETLYQLGG